MRCFIAINFPEEFRNEMKKIQDKLPNFVKNKTKLENLHLTLKFLGEIDEKKVELVKKQLEKIKFKKFSSNSGEIGFFDNKNKEIIWIHLMNCENLQKEVDESLKGLFPKEKKFMGHLTIARMAYLTPNRIKTIGNKKDLLEFLNEIKVSSMDFSVNEFYLMESILKPKGSEYKILRKYALV